MKLISIVFSFFLSLQIAFGYQLRGIVKDENGKALPYVTVFIKNSTHAVSSNLNGEYFIELKNGTYSINYSFIGYKPLEKEITISNSNAVQNVVLELDNNELDEISVSTGKRDYAFEIISRAIKAREENRPQYNSYTCNAYIKASIEKEPVKQRFDSIISKEKMDFVESYSTYSFKKPNHFKEEKLAYRDLSQKINTDVNISFNMEEDNYSSKPSMINQNLFKLNLDQAEFNFYDNLLNIPSLGEVPFTSPIAATALLSYKYKYIEAFEENGVLINKIEVIPRIENGALFKGYIYIIENTWAIKAVELELPSTSLIYYNYFKLFQEYEKIDNNWVVGREDFYYNTKYMGDHLLGNTLINYSDYEFNIDFEKRYFANELRVITDDALDKDSLYWEEIRPITLKDEERKYITVQDSIAKYEKSEDYIKKADSTYNHIDIWGILLNGIYHRNSYKKTDYYFNSLLMSANIFGVGGYRHSVGGRASKEFEKATKLDADYMIDYGIQNQDIKGRIGVGYMYNAKNLARVHGGYENTFDAVNKYESISNSFSRSNYVQLRAYDVGYQTEIINGLFADATIEYSQRESLSDFKLDKWSGDLFGASNIPQDFEGYDEFLLDLTLSIRFDQKYATEPNKKIIIGSVYPKIDINYKKAIPGIINSSLDFDYLEFEVYDDIKLGSMGISKFKFFAGKFLRGSNIMFTDHKFFRGSDPFLFSSPLRSFQLLGNSFNTRNEFFQLHYLHNFNGTLLNKIPLIDKLNMRTVAGASTLLIEDINFRHAEAFVGLELPFRLWKQVFKIGVYYVGADSNYSQLTSTFKIGLDMFNPYSNSWSY